MIRVKILLFAVLADQFGKSSLSVTASEGATVGDVLDELTVNDETKKNWLAPDRVATAVNLSYCGRQTVLHDGDEIALIPPVSGG